MSDTKTRETTVELGGLCVEFNTSVKLEVAVLRQNGGT